MGRGGGSSRVLLAWFESKLREDAARRENTEQGRKSPNGSSLSPGKRFPLLGLVPIPLEILWNFNLVSTTSDGPDSPDGHKILKYTQRKHIFGLSYRTNLEPYLSADQVRTPSSAYNKRVFETGSFLKTVSHRFLLCGTPHHARSHSRRVPY